MAYPTFSVLANYFVLHVASIGLNSGDTERTQSSPFPTACAYSLSENNSDDNKTTYITYLGRALMKFSTALRKMVILWKGVSRPNLIITLIIALGDLLALMILNRAIEPFDNVATSFVVAKRAVVVNRVTLSTNQVLDPVPDVSVDGLDVAIYIVGI